MWQHIEGMVESIVCVLLKIYFSFQQWKKIENPLRTDKVIAMSVVYYFFGKQCIYHLLNVGALLRLFIMGSQLQ